MRILITGANGFVGGHLCRWIESAEPSAQVMPTGFGCDGQMPVLAVTDLQSCKKTVAEFKPDLLIHLAAMAFVPQAEEHFAECLAINVGGTDNVCRALAELPGAPALLHISSAEVFGIPKQLPLIESSPTQPEHSYGLSKLMSEAVVERYHRQGKIRALIVRPFNHIGPGQNDRFVTAAFAKQVAEIALKMREPVISVGNLDAERDFCDVRDVVRGYLSAGQWLLKQEPKAALERLVFCSGQATKIRAVLDHYLRLVPMAVEIKVDPTRLRAADVPRIYGSYAHAQKLIGWSPEISVSESLSAVFEDWKRRLSAGKH